MDLPTEAEPVRVVEGDCLTVLRDLPDGCIDAVITDPPYGTGGYVARSGGRGGASGGKKHVRHDWDRWSLGWRDEAARVSAGAVVSFVPEAEMAGLWEGMAGRFDAVRSLVWCKPDPMPTFDGRVGYGTEMILTAGRLQPIGGRNWFEASTPRANRDAEHAGHPYQKPLSLMRWLVRLACPPGGLVLDPFGGSGSTAVACVMEGRRCLLVEKDPEYALLAQRRVSKAMGADSLFAGATP